MLGSSKLFDEFVMRRCEEITQTDEEYQTINNSILKIEDEIKALISGDALEKIIQYERLNLDLLAHSHTLFYKQALRDFCR